MYRHAPTTAATSRRDIKITTETLGAITMVEASRSAGVEGSPGAITVAEVCLMLSFL